MSAQVGIGPSGGIPKSNISSLDNPLAHPNLEFYRKPSSQNLYYPQSAQSAKENLGGQIVNQNDFSQYQDNYSNQESNPEPVQYNLDAYRKIPTPANNDFSAQNNYQDNYQYNNQSNDLQSYLKKDYEPRQDNKQAYKKALDQQIAEKEQIKYTSENTKIRNELDSINNYPFGRRLDNNYNNYNNNNNNYNNSNNNGYNNYISSSFNDARNYYNQVPRYQPTFSNSNNNLFEEPQLKLNKDNIIEKPNSLVADVPSYDPIKHRTGYHQGYNYDPWGKPGSGAPLIDSNGRKFTKYTGQVWYDTLGLTFDDRAKFYADKNRPLTLEEQKSEMEAERQRKRMEEANYKGRTGDLATWITDLENKRVSKIVNQGAHLPHTNVTREKINLEYARRTNINNTTRTYHDELGAQLEERNRLNKLYKLKEDVAGIEHTKKWDDWWGRPGGGAPNQDVRRRDLKETLESPRESNFEGTSLPMVANNKLTNDAYLYAKGTVRSNHRNLYDNMQPMKL